VPIKTIKMMVFDVDGVLSDGTLYYGKDGDTLKGFSARDGAGIKYLMRAGLECGIISGRDSEALRLRASELGIQHLSTGVKDKGPEFLSMVANLGLKPDQVAYMGDDLMDLPPMRLAGWSACPIDAVAEIRQAADLITSKPGGRGAAREAIEHLLRAQQRWSTILARYRDPSDKNE
jgi:3-deoxy-D-manno-octulosonate 8-phosphate phosphatase (KDO 8-P phosphatase)